MTGVASDIRIPSRDARSLLFPSINTPRTSNTGSHVARALSDGLILGLSKTPPIASCYTASHPVGTPAHGNLRSALLLAPFSASGNPWWRYRLGHRRNVAFPCRLYCTSQLVLRGTFYSGRRTGCCFCASSVSKNPREWVCRRTVEMGAGPNEDRNPDCRGESSGWHIEISTVGTTQLRPVCLSIFVRA